LAERVTFLTVGPPDGAMAQWSTRVAVVVLLVIGAIAVSPVAAAEPAQGVAGRVWYEWGEAAAGATILLEPGNLSVKADEDGTFHLAAPPGNYTLTATSKNSSFSGKVTVGPGEETIVFVTLSRAGVSQAALDPFPLLYLAAVSVTVIGFGFYVNKRMAETGIQLDKSIVGGAPVRKPWRRRRKRAKPPAS
jgi:hypothetical protein